MTTVSDLCTDALADSGVVGDDQVPEAGQINRAFRLANDMLAQWNRKRWLVYHLLDVSKVSTGAVSYTVGPGGDFDTPRPDRLEDGNFMRQLNTAPPQQVDYPLGLIPSREDYNRIRMKSLGTWPSWIFYDSGWPTGLAYPWPVPQASIYEIHIAVKAQLTQFTSLTQTINLPPEYSPCIGYNLQARLRAAYRLPPTADIIALAKDALNVIRLANVQVPKMRMPAAVIGRQRAYNVFSDNN